MANKTRHKVLELITARPGLHKSEICRSLDLSWGAVSHHLRCLKQSGEARLEVRGRRVHAFPASVPERYFRSLVALRSERCSKLMELLAREEALEMRELAARTGLSRKVLQRFLSILREAGLVQRDGRYRSTYRVSQSRIREVMLDPDIPEEARDQLSPIQPFGNGGLSRGKR